MTFASSHRLFSPSTFTWKWLQQALVTIFLNGSWQRTQSASESSTCTETRYFTLTDRKGSSSPKVKIPSHKFILAVSSPVFYKMFYTELKELSEYIDLPDCDSEGFLEFLRFIYCDEVKLTGDCVIQVLYLAKKYMIPALENRCRSFLQENINPVNVLDLLRQHSNCIRRNSLLGI